MTQFEYFGDSERTVRGILKTDEFEDQLRLANGGSIVTRASVRPLVPGLSGAAVFLVRRVGPDGPFPPWVVKAAKNAKLIISERENYTSLIKGRLQAAPEIIFPNSSKMLILSFGGSLANYNPCALRSGYERSNTAALVELMSRIVNSLQVLHNIHADTAACIERMSALTGLREKLRNTKTALETELIERLCSSWAVWSSKPDRYPAISSTGHGDLNSGNVLFEPGTAASYPIFIDFASMQISKDNKSYPPGQHLPFWDYAKLERDLHTRMFLKEALSKGVSQDEIISAIRYIDGAIADPLYLNLQSVQKFYKTTIALRKAVRQSYAPNAFQGCYRTVLAYCMLTVLLREEPDQDIDLTLQHRVAAEAALALLSEPFNELPDIDERDVALTPPAALDGAFAQKQVGLQLSYVGVTRIDPQCVTRLRQQSGEAELLYFDSISDAVGELHERDKSPQNFLRKNPYYRELRDGQERERRAASYHAHNDELLKSVERLKSSNNKALRSLLAKLNEALVPDELYSRSLGCFAAIAALLMIRELKKGYDWVEGITNAQPWFENFIFNPQGSCCLLDWIPNRSDTGRFVFGFRYWVEARVGHGSHHERYERVMFPLKYVLPLFLNGVKGDDEAYYTWVLPQLLLCGTYWPIEDFPSSKWQVFLLTGVNGKEWQGYHEPSPWPDIVDRIAIQEL